MIIHRVITWPVNHHQHSVNTPISFGKHMRVFVHNLWMELRGYGISCLNILVLSMSYIIDIVGCSVYCDILLTAVHLALHHHRHNGHQCCHPKVVGDYDHLLQLCLRLCPWPANDN